MLKLGVVTAYHNEVETIGQVVKVIAATKTPFLFFLVDDCSTKPPHAVLEEYGDEPWFHYLRNEDNLGPVGSLNRGIKAALAEGVDLVAINDADDISYPNRFSDQLSAFTADPDLMIVGGGADMADHDTGRILWRCHHPSDDASIRRRNTINSTFVHSTVVYRRAVFEKVGFYDASQYALDYDMITRVLAAGCKAANVPSLVLRYNIRAGSMSLSRRRAQLASRLSVQLKHFNPLNWRSYWGITRSTLAFLVPRDSVNRMKMLLFRLRAPSLSRKSL
ncbi:MAG: glycosyltransferase family 2 protein [Pseudomonadota bacterium]